MSKNPRHRYSEREESAIWAKYTPEEKETHNSCILGYSGYPANKNTIDKIRSNVMGRINGGNQE